MDLREKDGLSMVKVDRLKLLEKVKANRALHEKDYKESVALYKEAILAKLDTERSKVCQWKDQANQVDVEISISAPTEHLKDYDRVIASLEMSVDEQLHITAGQVSQFVMDEWIWKSDFQGSNVLYKSMTSRR